jgi:hypothetical protein
LGATRDFLYNLILNDDIGAIRYKIFIKTVGFGYGITETNDDDVAGIGSELNL